MEIDSPESQLTDGLLRGLSRSNEKKFVCNYLPDCKAAFSRQEHLQRHIRKHTGERPFSCGCGRTFTRLDNLRQHAQTVHSGTEMARISDEQNAIAAATKLRPTPNSPPPRVDGGSDSDPYPRPVTKLVKAKIKSARREIPPLPLSRSASPAPAPTPTPDPALPTTQEAQGQAQAQDLSMQPPVVTCENMLYTHHASLNSSTDHHQSSSSSTTTTTYHTGTPSFTTHTPYTQLSNFNPTAHYDVESSVGSQPISSLAKRRAPKHDFVYTGGHMMNSPGTMTSVSTDFDFSRATHDTTTPDEGEQMSEYINNGLEPKSTSTAATTTATTANTSTAPPSSNMDSHGDVPGILLHFACQNPDLT